MRRGPRDLELYGKARALRHAGASYKVIAAELKISPASAHTWTSDIELTDEQRESNRRKPHSRKARKARGAAWAARARARRGQFQVEGRRRARERDLLHHAGCMLYWAEGAKSRNRAKFANSDPAMVLLFRRFLTESLRLDRDEIRLTINAYTNNGLSIEEIERFWLDLLDLPEDCVRNHTLNHVPTSSSGRAKTRLRYGVCFLTVDRTWVVQHIYGAIQEYGGFGEPRWLD